MKGYNSINIRFDGKDQFYQFDENVCVQIWMTDQKSEIRVSSVKDCDNDSILVDYEEIDTFSPNGISIERCMVDEARMVAPKPDLEKYYDYQGLKVMVQKLEDFVAHPELRTDDNDDWLRLKDWLYRGQHALELINKTLSLINADKWAETLQLLKSEQTLINDGK